MKLVYIIIVIVIILGLYFTLKPKPSPPPVNCVGHWENVSGMDCNTTNYPSVKIQKYVIDTPSAYGGLNCPFENMTQMVICPMDCYGHWEDIPGMGCNPTTSDTTKQQRYVVDIPSMFGGKCDYLNATQILTCPIDCKVSDWSEISACSKNCGGGTQTQTRTIISQAQRGGMECPNLTLSFPCNTPLCWGVSNYISNDGKTWVASNTYGNLTTMMPIINSIYKHPTSDLWIAAGNGPTLAWSSDRRIWNNGTGNTFTGNSSASRATYINGNNDGSLFRRWIPRRNTIFYRWKNMERRHLYRIRRFK